MEWVDVQIRRGVRERSAPNTTPSELGLLPFEQRELLTLWVRKDNASRGRDSLLKEGGQHRIELSEALCDWLLREGWINRNEKLIGGHWRWEALTWRDLHTLKKLLGVGSKTQRNESRALLLEDLRQWLSGLEATDLPSQHRGLLDDLNHALSSLEQDAAQRVEVLEARDRWIRALYSWCLDERQGTRRDFALHAGEHTKSIGAGDWKWLEEHFELERYGVSHFTPMMWVAGQGVLHWDERTVDLNAVSFLALPLDDVLRVKAVTAAPAHWWLIENRTSFERQAQQLADGVLLAWMPGRPSTAWLAAIEHLAQFAPAPLRVSGDADPAGVDMVWGMGRVWERLGLPWEPFRMGLDELRAARQPWALNAHDKVLISRLLESPDLPQALHLLCLAMQRDGFKAEQEGWL